jgi:hypothetical protein
MSSQIASPADALDDTPVARVLRSAKRHVITALDLDFLHKWMDNGPGRNPQYPRSQMLRGLLLCTAEVKFRFCEIDSMTLWIPALTVRFGELLDSLPIDLELLSNQPSIRAMVNNSLTDSSSVT